MRMGKCNSLRLFHEILVVGFTVLTNINGSDYLRIDLTDMMRYTGRLLKIYLANAFHDLRLVSLAEFSADCFLQSLEG